MNKRTAKKIVAKYPLRPSQYTKVQIEEAYTALGKTPEPKKMEHWERGIQKAKDDKLLRAEAIRAAQAKNAVKRERAVKVAEARQAEKDRRAKIAADGEAKKKAAEAQAKAEAASKKAAEEAKETKETLPQKTVVGTDDGEVTIQKTGTDLAEKTIPELKTLCREHGVKGFSKLNKEGLIDALSGIDGL